MGLLNHLFGSSESIAVEIESDDEKIVKHWQDYLKTVSKKNADNPQELRKLLLLELTNICEEEKEEKELIDDLERIEHSKKIKRIHKLDQCLRYVETKYEYVYNLLHELDIVLKSQMHIAEKLLAKSENSEKLRSHLKSQFELEQSIITKISDVKTFHELFLALVKGEHIIHAMDAKEKKLLFLMQKGVGKIFSNEITEGITYDWAMDVFNSIEDKVHEGVANGIFPGYHPDIDFEFANRPEFVDLAKESIQKLRKRPVSEQMLNTFVHLFREWYNHERD